MTCCFALYFSLAGQKETFAYSYAYWFLILIKVMSQVQRIFSSLKYYLYSYKLISQSQEALYTCKILFIIKDIKYIDHLSSYGNIYKFRKQV